MVINKNIVGEPGVNRLCNLQSPKKTVRKYHTLTLITSNKQNCRNGHGHTMAILKNGIKRLQILPLNTENKNKELNTITNVSENNGQDKEQIIELHNHTKHKGRRNNNIKDKQKWLTFTYTWSYIRTITKLLKNTNIKMALNPQTQSAIYLGKHQQPRNTITWTYKN